jgi:nucleotide-binding universal stress UspA family protein
MKKMKTIIAATDFSPASMNAMNYAADMAMSVKAQLVLLNVYSLPVVYNNGPVITMPVEELHNASEKDLRKAKEQVLFRTAGEIKVTLKTRMGNITEELENISKSIQPFAVVIGTKGKTNFEKAVFGSAAYSIIKHLSCPVICVPPGRDFGTGIRKIGFACDFKNVSETTPHQVIKQFIHEFKAELHILNVDYKGKRFKYGAPEESFSLHQMFLDEKPHYHYIDDPDIEKSVNEFAEKNTLDLLITIPKKHNLLEKIFSPGNTRQLISKSQVPIMCIHEYA